MCSTRAAYMHSMCSKEADICAAHKQHFCKGNKSNFVYVLVYRNSLMYDILHAIYLRKYVSKNYTCGKFFYEVHTANLSCLLATTFSSLRFLFNFTSLQSFESGQRGFLFSHFRVFSSILSLSFLCSSVSEALFTLSFSFLSERFFFVMLKLL